MIIQRMLSAIIAGMYGLGFIVANIIPSDRYPGPAGSLFSSFSIFSIILLFVSVFTCWLFDPVDASQSKKTIANILLVIIMLPIIYMFVNLLKPLL